VDLYGVSGTDTGNVYAVGLSGQIQRFGGSAWTSVSSGFSTPVNAIWGTSVNDIWVFTNDRYAHHFDGAHWTAFTLPGIGYSATGTAPNDMWVGGDLGVVYRWDGSAFSSVTTRDTGSRIKSIYIAAPDRVVLSGTSSVQFWDGARFTTSFSSAGTAAWGTGPNDIWVGADGASNCSVYHYDGASWTTRAPIGCSGIVSGIHGTATNDVYMVTEGTTLLYHWDGTKFSTTSIGSPYGKSAVFATPTRVFVTTTIGEVITGLGSSWMQGVQVDARLGAIMGFGADKVWVGGDQGFVLSYKP
jgi:hypothetical protein